MIVSCRRAVELTSKELDTALPLGERLALAAHRVVCPACRRFRTQVVEIDRAVAEYIGGPAGADDRQLPDESKVRIKDTLRGAATEDGDTNPNGR